MEAVETVAKVPGEVYPTFPAQKQTLTRAHLMKEGLAVMFTGAQSEITS